MVRLHGFSYAQDKLMRSLQEVMNLFSQHLKMSYNSSYCHGRGYRETSQQSVPVTSWTQVIHRPQGLDLASTPKVLSVPFLVSDTIIERAFS
jgi:hypothetical protein